MDEQVLNVLFYNTHLFGGIFFAEMGIEYHKDEKRRQTIVDLLNNSNYDVVGLCEVLFHCFVFSVQNLI